MNQTWSRVWAGSGRGTVRLGEDISVGGEEVSGRGEWGQTPCHVGQERQIGETLDMGLQLFPNLGHPRQLLLVLLQRRR